MEFKKQYTSSIKSTTLFKAWLSSEMTVDPVYKIECNPVVGGYIRLYSGSPEDSTLLEGVIMELIEGQKLIYSWQWEGAEETSVVEVEFIDEGLRSVINLVHKGFTSEKSLALHTTGWDSYFEGLVRKIDKLNFN